MIETEEMMTGLLDLVPGLTFPINGCPADRECLALPVLWRRVIHLNDTHGWTREHIADWLESLDVDLSFRSQEVTPEPSSVQQMSTGDTGTA